MLSQIIAPQLMAALLLFVLSIVILVGRWTMRWRAALFCGVAAFWLWSMALGLASFIAASAELGPLGDPSVAVKGVGDALIHGACACLLCLPLLGVTGTAFFVHQEPR